MVAAFAQTREKNTQRKKKEIEEEANGPDDHGDPICSRTVDRALSKKEFRNSRRLANRGKTKKRRTSILE